MGWEDIKVEGDHLSASQIAMFQRCPKQWEFRYVKKMKMPPTGPMVMGSAVHSGIEHNYKHKYITKKPANKNEVMDQYDYAWERMKHGADFEAKDPGKLKDTGYAMANLHYDSVAPTVEPVEVPEIEVKVQIPGVKRMFVGYFDLIGKLTSKLKRVIIDNKTTMRKFEEFAVDLSGQLTSYDILHKLKFGKRPDGALNDVLVGTKGGVQHQRIITERTQDELDRFTNTVQLVEKAIDAGIFYPTDDPKTCSWCGYAKICVTRAFEKREKMKLEKSYE